MIIIDEVIFSDSYLPRKLWYREEELSRLTNFIEEGWKSSESRAVLIHGKIGVGKTALARKSLEILRDGDVIVLYADGIGPEENSEAKILRKALRKMWPDASLEGISSAEISSLLANALITKDKRIVIAIDEAPNVLSHGSGGMYSLLENEKCRGRVSIILCALDLTWVYSYLELSKVTEVLEINLKGFTKSQLFDIVKDRAEEGLKEGSYDEEILDFVAELSSSEGTPRAAIKTLYYAAKIAEERGSDEISPEDVRKASEKIPASIPLSKIYSMDWLSRVVLLAAYQILERKPYARTQEIEEKCKEILEVYFPRSSRRISITSVRRRLKWLVKIGMLQERKGEKRKGSIFSAEFPISLLIERLEEAISNESKDLGLY